LILIVGPEFHGVHFTSARNSHNAQIVGKYFSVALLNSRHPGRFGINYLCPFIPFSFMVDKI
jgi:hypothetical protein